MVARRLEREEPKVEGAWPAVGWAEHRWHGDTDAIPSRYRQTYTGPYRAAVVPAINQRSAQMPSGTRALLDEATAEIARFDAEVGRDFAPLEAVLLRSESAASSQIEHLTASARAIALAELGDTSRRNALLITDNSRAMMTAINLADQLTSDSIIEMHRVLLERSNPRITGRWRQSQVWIGTNSFGPHTASFVPPHHEEIPAAMDDLVAYMARDDVPVLEHVAIAHAQFETIHPFPDGNGRTGRALVQSMLRAKLLTRTMTLPVSGGLLANQEGYIAALDAYRRGDPMPILERFAEASHFAVFHGRMLAAALADVKSDWAERIVARPQAVVWRAIDAVLRQGVVDAGYLERELGVTDVSATDAISRLVEAGALRQIGEGRRNRRYEAPEVLAALDAFADAARRVPRDDTSLGPADD